MLLAAESMIYLVIMSHSLSETRDLHLPIHKENCREYAAKLSYYKMWNLYYKERYLRRAEVKKGRVIKNIVFLTVLMAVFMYRLWRQNHPLDLGEFDYCYILFINPLFIFAVCYIVSRCVFNFSVCTVNQKGIRAIFLVEAVVLSMYAVSLILFTVFNYAGLWLEYHYLQVYYSWLLMFCSSSQGAVFCAFAAVFLALAVTGKRVSN